MSEVNVTYNVPSVPRSGIRPAISQPKIHGSHLCLCGRVVSANKEKCASCAGVRS